VRRRCLFVCLFGGTDMRYTFLKASQQSTNARYEASGTPRGILVVSVLLSPSR
jgi:hypothetical protein